MPTPLRDPWASAGHACLDDAIVDGDVTVDLDDSVEGGEPTGPTALGVELRGDAAITAVARGAGGGGGGGGGGGSGGGVAQTTTPSRPTSSSASTSRCSGGPSPTPPRVTHPAPLVTPLRMHRPMTARGMPSRFVSPSPPGRRQSVGVGAGVSPQVAPSPRRRVLGPSPIKQGVGVFGQPMMVPFAPGAGVVGWTGGRGSASGAHGCVAGWVVRPTPSDFTACQVRLSAPVSGASQGEWMGTAGGPGPGP